MVQPYLRRRMGREAVTYPHPSLQPVLERTLGIPLFQEQLMRLAMVAGGLSGGEAQELRKLMTRGYEGSVISTRMAQLITRLRAGMTGKGIVGEAQEQVVQGIAAFAQYGFPESHAMSWALMVYMSLFLKVHHPAVFLAALLNHQPMGFYAPDTLIQDAKRHGVRVEPACALESSAGCRVLDARSVRLGLQAVRGVGQAAAERLVHARALRPLRDVADAVARAQLSPGQAEALARAGAFAALGRARRAALWDVRAAVGAGGLALAPEPGASPLPEPDAAGQTLLDYAQTHATVGPHLVSLLRPLLARLGARSCVELGQARDGERVRLGGLVICRQRPQTAKGTLFLTVEDETGLGNGVVQVDRQAELRLPLRAPLVLLEGRLQARDGVHMVLVERAWPLPRPAEGVPTSHDFR
jgi:error-prone DNA polymerase